MRKVIEFTQTELDRQPDLINVCNMLLNSAETMIVAHPTKIDQVLRSLNNSLWARKNNIELRYVEEVEETPTLAAHPRKFCSYCGTSETYRLIFIHNTGEWVCDRCADGLDLTYN